MPERTRRRTTIAADGVVLETSREPSEREKLERALWNRINEAGLPAPQTQYLWARPERMFRADFAYVAERILIEVQGGIWARDPGRHNRGSGYTADLQRTNLAMKLGWKLLAFTEAMIKSGEAISTIRQALTSTPLNAFQQTLATYNYPLETHKVEHCANSLDRGAKGA